ncbi:MULTISPECIES: restriction endonuclease subunit S [Enterobacter cloacae complex]|uniref:restriction endonuclease subunit S n=1 Tax=Enterobacter cloacae complex TaxID=354276 RepID=UPI0003BE8569|nr:MULTISPECIES: restriction endonuclease subunit S [Enterobacter cloacae complex]CAE7632229.1 Type-1 restriction enzyme EcoKI specificity protein [Enterobacter cloacae]ELE6989858.1 restriction endonuclease subunit S [Enterobacter kobei]ELE9699794.1 restriction endonuclease subunit S [Enterobacter kobei]ELE9721198.1 restriction endonuclease subunit S [Enterobacter kobei]ELE9739921.1 restriction endonuclease subunit S [Enterobacter kobei]
MAKYKAYPEYKDSGVEWLGELPAHWTTLAIKHVAQLNPSKSSISVEKMKGMCSFIPMEKLKFNSLCLDEIKDVTDVYNGYTYFENEDILIAKVTPCFENKNMVVAHDLNNGIGFGSSEIYVLRCNDIINNNFLFYRLQEDNFMSIAEGAMTGAGGLKRVPSEVLNNFKFGLPSKKEQSIIVDFLDHETTKIDNMIEKQQQLIELLKEKRQAVISHAVTKGLNSDAPMKDSGVEWLGEVPEHWVPIQLGKVCYQVSDGPHFSPNYVDSGVLFISARNIKVNGWSLDDAKYITEKDYNEFSKRVIPEIGDVLYTKGGTTGIARTVDIEDKFQVWVHVAVLKILKEKAVPDFIAYSLNGTSCYAQSQLYTQGATNNDLGLTRLIKIWLALPPKNEQQEIVDALNSITKKYDVVTDNAMTAITILLERRAALISAAVTGRIDVRDWVAPDTQGTEESQEATA